MDYPAGNKGRLKSLPLAQLLFRTGKDCPGFEGCKAPICPLSTKFRKAVWYADEPICASNTYQKEQWRITQQQIAKLRGVKGSFSLARLQSIKQVHPGIKGLLQ